MRLSREWKHGLLLGPGTWLVCLLLSLNQPVQNLENLAFDSFTRWTSDVRKWPDDIIILAIDDASLRRLGEKYGWRWPWPRSSEGILVAALKKAGARAVFLDILFTEHSEDTLEDERLANFLNAAGNVWLAALQDKAGHILEPIPILKQAVGPRTAFVNIEKDHDGVLRRYSTRDLWNNSNRKPPAIELAALTGRSWAGGEEILLRWHATYQELDEHHLRPIAPIVIEQHSGLQKNLLDPRLAAIYESPTPASFTELIQSAPTETLRALVSGKVVLIGCSGAGTFDAVATPLDGYQPGVLVHATALANLLRDDFLRPVAPWLPILLALAITLIVTAICLRVPTIIGQALSTLLLILLVALVSLLLFRLDLWLPPLMAMSTGFAAYTATTAYNYFVAGKQKRQLKQLFSDFVSPDVLAEIQRSPDEVNLHGENRVGTVLFCDLAGFTTFIESSPPPQAFDAINLYLAEASRRLMARGAYVDKFIGDAVMAIFSVPRKQPDHAVQACLAALELQQMMKEINEELGRKYGVKLELRTGVNTGSMSAGTMGYARRRNYSVLGDTVNLASRLEGANKEYHTHTMIGPATWELSKEHTETRLLDYLRVKGKKQPVRVYELMARKGELTPDLARLRAAYQEGIELYRQRFWQDARLCFERALAIFPKDGPSRTYLERCAALQNNPPPPDWDGSFQLDSK